MSIGTENRANTFLPDSIKSPLPNPERLSPTDHAVIIIGGAVAGSSAARHLAENGIRSFVIEREEDPFGKVQRGLPFWHAKDKEYAKIALALSHPLVTYIPATEVNADPSIASLQEMGPSAILVATGAWRDRRTDIPGLEEHSNFMYQNAFIEQMNETAEQKGDWSNFPAGDNTVVVGGGLASFDVHKGTQFARTANKLTEKGIDIHKSVNHKGTEMSLMVLMKRKGISEVLTELDLNMAEMELDTGCTLIYRKGVGDMPLRGRTPELNERIAQIAINKYGGDILSFAKVIGYEEQEDRITGLKVIRTQWDNPDLKSRLQDINGSETIIPADQVIYSIGSIPERIEGLPVNGELYSFDESSVVFEGHPRLYALGNVRTGQGHIKESEKDAQKVAGRVKEDLFNENPESTSASEEAGKQLAEQALGEIIASPTPDITSAQNMVDFAKKRWAQTGYDGDLFTWLKKRGYNLDNIQHGQ